jgi:hypothetical protein
MPEAAAVNLLTGLSRAIEDGDADRARRRLGELNMLLRRLPGESLVAIQQRLQVLLADAQALKAELGEQLHDRPRQRRSIDAYRQVAGQR